MQRLPVEVKRLIRRRRRWLMLALLLWFGALLFVLPALGTRVRRPADALLVLIVALHHWTWRCPVCGMFLGWGWLLSLVSGLLLGWGWFVTPKRDSVPEHCSACGRQLRD